MSSKNVFTNIFRISYPHLVKPQEPQNAGEQPKYGFSMMFPKTNIIPVNGKPTTSDPIFIALNEVCLEQFNQTFAQATAQGMGIQFPPQLKDGDLIFAKDANGNPVAGQVEPNTAGMWILSVKNADPIGCCDPTGQINISSKEILAGYWCASEVECSAYVNKNGQKVVSVKALNVQLCYLDETFGRAATSDASTSFANRGIADSNIAQGSIQGVIVAAPVAASIAPPVIAQAPIVAPAVIAPPIVAVAPVNNDPVIMNAGEAPYADQLKAGWTAELLVAQGKAVVNVLNPAV